MERVGNVKRAPESLWKVSAAWGSGLGKAPLDIGTAGVYKAKQVTVLRLVLQSR